MPRYFLNSNDLNNEANGELHQKFIKSSKKHINLFVPEDEEETKTKENHNEKEKRADR